MRLEPFTTFAICALTFSPMTRGGDVLRTAAEINGLQERDPTQTMPFRLRGTVIARLHHDVDQCSFVLQDESGRVHAVDFNSPGPAVGDIIGIEGKTGTDEGRWYPVVVSSWEKVGQGSVPPPEPVTIGELSNPKWTLHTVVTEGIIEFAAIDDIDSRYDQILLKSENATLNLSRRRDATTPPVEPLVGAHVRATGVLAMDMGGYRRFVGRLLYVAEDGIKILKPASTDPFDVKPLEHVKRLDPTVVSTMGRRRTTGTIEAVWNGGRSIILGRTEGLPMRVDLLEPTELGPGTEALVTGLPTTDRYRINFKYGRIRAIGTRCLSAIPGSSRIDHKNFGLLLRVEGRVLEQPVTEEHGRHVSLDCDNRIIVFDAGKFPDVLDGIGAGYRIAATGICVFDAGEWYPNAPLPRIESYTLIARTPRCVEILEMPSMWTVGRLLVIIGILFAILVGILIWNRILNRIIERRSRQLMREEIARTNADIKLEERTRLAVELHDTIAQNLTGVALQIDVAQMAAEKDPSSVMPYLESTRLKMQNCRDNLRDCLWDLRSRVFDEKELSSAIVKTLAPHLGNAKAAIDCDIRCQALSDNSLHAVLCIVRELTVNAIRHGKARAITVSIRIRDERLSLVLTDDGSGFDPTARAGMKDGHFGLQGVAERISRLGGTWSINSAPGRGCTITVDGLDVNG